MFRPVLLAACLLTVPLPLVSWTPLAGAALARAESGAVIVEQPWARATPGSGSTGVVYLTVTARGAADQITGISTPAAEMAMIHESFVDGGVSKMRMLDGVKLAPQQPVVFGPGGLHIMLEGLAAPLRVGATFPLTLTFAHAAPQTVTVTVLKAGAPGPDPRK